MRDNLIEINYASQAKQEMAPLSGGAYFEFYKKRPAWVGAWWCLSLYLHILNKFSSVTTFKHKIIRYLNVTVLMTVNFFSRFYQTHPLTASTIIVVNFNHFQLSMSV